MDKQKIHEISKQETVRQLQFIEKLKEYFYIKSEELGRPLTAHIATFGCHINVLHEMA